MTPQERLGAATRIFLDTAPVIYFVEANPAYLSVVEDVFRRLDSGSLTAISSPVTLAECLVHPLRRGNSVLADSFVTLLKNGPGASMVGIDPDDARVAANLRARHNLTLTDALQLACSIRSGCDVFLTNDIALKRVAAANVVCLDELRSAPIP